MDNWSLKEDTWNIFRVDSLFACTIQMYSAFSQTKKMFSLDEENIFVHLATFLVEQESRECFVYISDIGTRGIYLFLTLGTAKFKQLE